MTHSFMSHKATRQANVHPQAKRMRL